MNPATHAIRLGLRRGWTEFTQSLRSVQDQGYYVFTGLAVLGYLLIRRDDEVDGTDLLVPSVSLPGRRSPTACAATSPARCSSTASASCRSC